MELTRINNNTNGTPRYAVHFLNLLSETENNTLSFDEKYYHAIYKAKALHGKKYHNKQYGGGIAFATYLDENQLIEKLKKLQQTTI